MSDESKPTNGDWQMPEPVFRTSEGRTPKSAKNFDQDDVDTASPDLREADTEEIETDVPDQDEIDTETPESEEEPAGGEAEVYQERPPKNVVRPAVAKPAAGGCAKTISLILGIIAISGAALLSAIVYFLYFYRPTDSTF